MSFLDVLSSENRQLARNPYKLLALFIFVFTSFYGLWKGYNFYKERHLEILRIETQKQEMIDQASTWLENDITGPENRPWVNIKQPFWAMWYANHHTYDDPSPLMIYSIGQADQFAFYKRVSMWTTGYDPDLIADLHNPEFVGIGSLDFTFVWIFLMPILLIILLYDVKGLEYDLDFLKSIALFEPNEKSWIVKRLGYYFMLMSMVLLISIGIPFLLESMSLASVLTYFSYGIAYMLFWFFIYFLIIRKGKGQTDQAVKMLVVWLFLAVIIPGSIHQYLNLKYPPNFMMDWLTTKRVEQNEIFALSYDETVRRVNEKYDWLPTDEMIHEDSVSQPVKNSLYRMVLSLEFNQVVDGILEDLENKNSAIRKAYLISPVTFFQNRFNNICGTDYYTNRDFRESVQNMGHKINEMILRDEISNAQTDESRFREYQSIN